MVKQTYEFIAGKLRALNLFERVFTYAELIDTAQGSYPAQYVGDGNYKPIDISSYAGVAYTRKTEPIRFEEEARESLVGCERYDIAIMPLRVVVSVKKHLLNCDHTFGAEFLMEELYRKLSGRFTALAEDANVNDASIVIKKAESDRLIIIQEEYAGSSLKELPYDWMIVAMDIEARLIFDRKCITKFCDGYEAEENAPCDPCPECPPEVPALLYCDYIGQIDVPKEDLCTSVGIDYDVDGSPVLLPMQSISMIDTVTLVDEIVSVLTNAGISIKNIIYTKEPSGENTQITLRIRASVTLFDIRYFSDLQQLELQMTFLKDNCDR